MSNGQSAARFTTRSHRFVNVICYVLIAVVAFRRVSELDGLLAIGIALALIGFFTALYATEPLLTRRFKFYPRVFFILQMALVQILGVFRDYIDAWAILYIVLGFQVALRCSRRGALLWGGLFVASALVTLSFEFGPISGVGRALAYAVIGIFIISYDIQVSQHEDALAESQVLLTELQEAHEKLQVYAAQADQLAAAQERNRMLQELHDAVGQKVFAIQLAAETTRLILEKDPGRAAAQIEALHEQTQSALSQMRQLIDQWRPG
ncbi:MAG: histidine kinase [Anaerolineales bacterium]|jgi:signal transduction histidine kinase|nr:histidine kinase [Anaerolineales bacterium]